MKRDYQSDIRETRAENTRQSILSAAKQLFQTKGFDKVTIAELAKKAEVATPTVYAVFKSKRGVLQSLIDEALPQRQFHTLVEHAMSEKSPRKRLQISAKIARSMYDAEKGLMDILRGASVVAPEFRKLELEREKRRYKRQGEYVNSLMEDGVLATGLTLKKARDILWMFTGRDIYRMMVLERGWSSVEYEKWLAKTLIDALLVKSKV